MRYTSCLTSICVMSWVLVIKMKSSRGSLGCFVDTNTRIKLKVVAYNGLGGPGPSEKEWAQLWSYPPSLWQAHYWPLYLPHWPSLTSLLTHWPSLLLPLTFCRCLISVLIWFQSLETLDNGKPYADAYNADVPLSIKTYRLVYKWGIRSMGITGCTKSTPA